MRFAQGPCREDEEKIEALMAAHGTSIKRLCCLYLKDAVLAEDAAQETFVKAWRNLHAFRGECSERTWLTRIAVNVCRDMLRTAWLRRVDRRVTPEELTIAAPEPEEPALAQAITRLPARDREILLLRCYEQLSAQEIAALLRQPVNTVKSRLTRAKKKLRRMLDGRNDDA